LTVCDVKGLEQHPLVRAVSSALAAVDWSATSGVVAAVSGGRDSVALAAAMVACQARVGLPPLTVAHVHHHRRAEADEEADAVRRLAGHLACNFEIRHIQLGDAATPAELRDARYDALVDVAASARASTVATAHQAEDQLETVLLAMIRGAGPRGLVGMRPQRPLGSGVQLIRPMLRASREQATDLCRAAGLPWHDDPTNVDPDTLRGRLRADVLPLLEAIRPGVADRLARSTSLRAAAADALAASVMHPVDGRWDRSELASVGEGLRVASIEAAAMRLTGSADGLSGETLRRASAAIADRKRHRRLFELGAGAMLVVEADAVRIDQATQPIESRPPM
jgi:tRNA(Ile)-lysidine synthase